MPAKSPIPTPRQKDKAMSLSRSTGSETPSFATMASVRKLIVTPSPTGTAATAAMTPMMDTPQTPDAYRWFSSQSGDVSDTQPSRLYVSLHEDDDRGEAPPHARSPDGEWRVRALFLGGKVHKSPSPEQKRGRSLHARSSLISLTESDSSGPSTSRLKQSRRRKSPSANQRHSSSSQSVEDEWSGDFSISTRRRSSSSNISSMVSPEQPNKNPLPETPTTSSSSDTSPEESPNRHSATHKRIPRCTSPVPETDVSNLKAWLTYRLGRVGNNRLLFILCMVAIMSLGITVMTNRAVINVEEAMDDEELEKVMTKYERMHESSRSMHPPAGGLRGSLVHTRGRYKGKGDHPKESKKDSDHGKKMEEAKHKEDAKSKTEKNQATAPKNQATTPKTSSETKAKSSEKVELKPKKLTVASPRKKLSFSNVKQAFNDVDHKMFDHFAKPKDIQPRILYLHDSITEKTAPVHDHVQVYPSDFTDNTQLYGVLDSGDERLSRMELREPYEDEHCVPMKEWQTTFHPSCNGMHEMSLDHMVTDVENDINLFGTKGFWRNAWKVDVLAGNRRIEDRETVVLKTLKFEHKFEDAHFEHDRIDAVVMERLTSSPHVINVFGFCGHSVVTEYAEGTRVGTLADKSARIPLARLKIARDIAMGLADVHGIDGDGNATFVHLDINPANVVSIGGTLKLNDFNIGIILRWNQTSNQHCGFPAQYPNPQWRSPEEARNEPNLTEKVDIFSMGHIFFRLICGHEPWNKLEPGRRPSKEEVNAKVQKGMLPHIPKEIMETTNKEEIAIRDAMLRCYTFDPSKRPSARVIANALQSALDELSASS